MSQKTIGKVSFINEAWVVAKIQFIYKDQNGDSKVSEKTGDITKSKNPKIVDPGELGVPDGSVIQLKVIVVAGKDQESETTFLYKKQNTLLANYHLSGYTFKSKLELTSVSEASWNNWSQNIVYKAPGEQESYFYPANRKELQSIIQQATEASVTLRSSGQRHSQPPLVTADNRSEAEEAPTGWLIDMSCYADLGPNQDQRIIMDPSGLKVSVNTGVREDELDAFLTKNNKMLRTVTAGGFFSLGGMTAVDVHGATIDAPIFAETASEFNIMGADGSITKIDDCTPASKDWKAIQFARVSLGALGIVTSVTIDIMERPWATTLSAGKASFNLANEQEFIAKFKELCATHTRMETFFIPYTNKYLALWWDIDENPTDKIPNQPQTLPDACELAHDDEYGAPYEGKLAEPIAEALGLAAQSSGDPSAASGLMDIAYFTIEGLFNKAAKIHSDLWLTKAARVMFMSYFLELPDLDDAGFSRAWQGLNAVTNRLNTSTDFLIAAPMEFRFIKGGDTALANTYTKTPGSTFINLDLIGFVKATESSEYPSAMLQFFADIEREWIALGGLPHNGKMYGFYDPNAAPGTFTPPFNPAFINELAKRRIDRISAFDAYRSQQDPAGRFSNAYVDAILGKGKNSQNA